MKTVILVRHAKSSWAELGVSDIDRPLNNRGKKDAPEMAKRLRNRDIPIDLFMSSPATRAKRTAQLFAEELKYKKNNILYVPELYLPTEENFISAIRNTPPDKNSIIIFSHNPGITSFANSLGSDQIDNMPTCSVFGVSAKCKNWNDFIGAEKTVLFFDYPKLI